MRAAIVGALALCMVGPGCGPTTSLETDGDGSTSVASSSGEAPPSSTTTATTTTSSDGSTSTSDGTTTTTSEDGSGEADGTEGCSFTCPPPPPPPMDGMCNCPEGEKCMPRSIDGTETWNGIRCSPIAPDPGAPGDPCTVEGNQWSGIDDCEYGAMCFGVDPETNEGVCVSFCSWLGDGPCLADTECQVQPGDLGLPVCVPSCDPTAPACPADMACFAGGSSFTCQPLTRARQPVGSPCSTPAACVDGALCAYGLECGQAVGEGCCAEVCDLDQPAPCPGPAVCTPWFGGAGGPQWDHVGYCVE